MSDAGTMAAFGASETACYRWPMDTVEHRAMRAAYCDGAAGAAEETKRLTGEVSYLKDAVVPALRDEIERLRAALLDSYQDQLFEALGDGVTGNGGKWWPGGMSNAEWFCRQAGIDAKPQFTASELRESVPAIAATMVAAIHQQIAGEK